MSVDNKTFFSKVAIGVITALATILLAYATQGFNSISRVEAQDLIKVEESKHEAKIDLVMTKLVELEVAQARVEEIVKAIKESQADDKRH